MTAEALSLSQQRVLVVGGGKSGLASIRKLQRLGAEIFLADRQPLETLPGVTELGLDGTHLILGQEPNLDEIRPDLLVTSPGVSPQLPFIQAALLRNIPLWSEVELALRDARATIIGITGSNGKTTTTTLIGDLAKATGRETVVAGNIGLALSGQIEHLDENGIVVAELSSFQLEWIDQTRIQMAVLLNVTPDHLDRHGTIENYGEAKARILENQRPEDLAVLNWDDPMVRAFSTRTKAQVVFISQVEALSSGVYFDGETIFERVDGQSKPIIRQSELLLRGRHNIENAMAAVAVARRLGLAPEAIAEVLRHFEPVKHRQEIVGTYEGILYINDSKGTNPDSAIKALQSYQEPIVLIAGGKNKGLDMTAFLLEANKRVKSLILVGQAAQELEEVAVRIGMTKVFRSSSFEDAVEKAIQEAQTGDVVLLSPACTSWDMFHNYEERGELFKDLVRKHYKKP